MWVQHERQLWVGNKHLLGEEDMLRAATHPAPLVHRDKEVVGHRDCSGVEQHCGDTLDRHEEVLHGEVVLPEGVHAADGADECGGVEYGGVVDGVAVGDIQLAGAVCHRLLVATRKKWEHWVAMLPWELFVAGDHHDLDILGHHYLDHLLLVDCIVPLCTINFNSISRRHGCALRRNLSYLI